MTEPNPAADAPAADYHRAKSRSFWPEPDEYADAKAALGKRRLGIGDYLRASLRYLNRSPESALNAVREHWPAPRQPGRPRREADPGAVRREQADEPPVRASSGNDAVDPGAPWQVANVRPVLDSPWLRVDLADVTKPSGRAEEHYMVTLPAAVVVVALDEPGENVLLAWRHRCVPDVWSHEVPGGLVEDGEDPAAAARRELAEETGYRAGDLRHLVTYEPAVGSVRAPHHVFLARGLERVGEPVEHDEGVFGWVPLASVPGLVADGKVASAGALVGLLHVLADRA